MSGCQKVQPTSKPPPSLRNVAQLMVRIMESRGTGKGMADLLDEVMREGGEPREVLKGVEHWVKGRLVDGLSDTSSSAESKMPQQTIKKTIKVPTKPKKSTGPICPAWLAYSNLPGDGTVPSAGEIIAFSNFVIASQGEHSTRSIIRGSLQKLIQSNIGEDITIKLIGSWSYGLATFSSPLDLVVEAADPSAADEALQKIHAMFTERSIPVSWHTFTNFTALKLSSSDLTDGGEASRDAFSIYLVSNGSQGPPSSRLATTKVSQKLNSEFAEHKPTAVIIRSVIQKTNIGDTEGGINGYMITLLFLAFVEHHRGHPHVGDPGWVLRQFFNFFSTFDFASTSVVPFPHDGRSFIPRVIEDGSQLCIHDPCSPPSALVSISRSVTKLAQLVGTVQYINMLIQRYDRNSKGTALLPNLIACGKPFTKRHTWLKTGFDVTRELAVEVMRSLADYLESPNATCDAKSELFRIAVHSTALSYPAEDDVDEEVGPEQDKIPQMLIVLKQRLLARLICRNWAGMAQYRGRVPHMAEAMNRYKADPIVMSHFTRCMKASVDKEYAMALTKEIADYFTDPKHVAFRNEMKEARFRLTHATVALKLFTKVANMQSSLAWDYRHCLPSFLAVLETNPFQNDEDVDFHRHRIMKEMMSPKLAAQIAAEAANEIQSLAESHDDATLKPLLEDGDWSPGSNFSSSDGIFKHMRSKKESTLSCIEGPVAPVVARILSSDFKDDPDVKRYKQQAATAVLTKPVAAALQRYAVKFRNEHSGEHQMEVLHAICSEIKSKKSTTGSAELDTYLRPFADDPTLLANQDVAERVFADLSL